MSDQLWEKYDEISDMADIQISKEKEEEYYIVERKNGKKIAGPFTTNEEAAMQVIAGTSMEAV